MKFFYLTILMILFVNQLFAQCPTAALEMESQADVNSFPGSFPGCTVIPDGIDIKIMGNDIVDLSPLAQITTVLGAFEIRECPSLVTLSGLENLTKVGNDALDGFILRDLPGLTNISALTNLDSITGEFTIRTCEQLTNLSGFSSLVYNNGSVIIRDNAALLTLEGINGLKYIGETLEIVENPVLTDISALSNVDTIVGGIEGGVFIEANDVLTSLDGLGHGNTEIGGNLDLLLNGDLALCSVPSICKYLGNPPVDAIITITGNTTGCNTQAEIEENCEGLSVLTLDKSQITVSPNPFNDYLLIDTDVSTSIQLIDALGKSETYYINSGVNKISTSHLSNGLYIVKDENGICSKFIK